MGNSATYAYLRRKLSIGDRDGAGRGLRLAGAGLLVVGFEVWLFGSHPRVALVQLLVCVVFVLLAIRRTRKRIRKMRLDRGAAQPQRFLAGFDLQRHDPTVVRMVYEVLVARSRYGGQVQILADDDLEIVHDEDPSEMPVVISQIGARLGLGERALAADPRLPMVRTPREMVDLIEAARRI